MKTRKQNRSVFLLEANKKNIDFYYISQSFFHLSKNTIPNISNIIILFKQTVRDIKDIKLLFHDIAGLDMNVEEWKISRKAWESDYGYLKIDRFAKKGQGRYTKRNCNKMTYIESTPETKPF